MKSTPLIAHYQRQLEYLRSVEEQLLEVIAGLKRRLPGVGFAAAVADIDSCSRGRLDSLRALSPGPLSDRCRSRHDPAVGRAMSEIFTTDGARAQALAICLCATLDRQLIHAYRIARQLAERLSLPRDAHRLDAAMAALADRGLCWNPVRGLVELQQMDFVAG